VDNPPMQQLTTPPPDADEAAQRRAFSRAVEVLSSSLDFGLTLEHTIAVCLPALADFGFFDVVHGDEVRRTARAHDAPALEAELRATRWVRQEARDGGLNLCALSSGLPALHADIDDAWYVRVAANEGHLAVLRRLAFRSMITVPMHYRGELVGALTLFMAQSGRQHTQRHLEAAAELALIAAPVVVHTRLLQQHEQSEAALRASEQRLRLLATAGAVMARSLEPQATLDAIAATVVPAIADWCRVDLLDADGRLQRALTHHADPERKRQGMELVQRLRAAEGTPGSMAWVVETGLTHQAEFVPPHAYDAVRDRDLLSFAQAIGMRSYFIVPLVARGRTLGALAALQAESGRSFNEDDRALITELAHRAALAIDNARAHAQTEAALRQAESANRAKDEFLAILGHELRNPLAPIVTALHLMKRRDAHVHADERAIIERQVAHLSRLVDDLLDVSRITQGKVQLALERVDLRAVAERALELAQPVLAPRARPVDVMLGDAPLPVHGDAVRLAQAVANLLTNAAKFTPPDGRIALGVRRDGDEVVLEVKDEGAGISAELLPRVFDLFVQGEQPLDRRAGGLGLGLSIVKMLVALHDGRVSAHSAGPGAGSRFAIRLPAGDAPAQPAASAPDVQAPPRRQGRILVVDDNVDAAETLALLLDDAGYDAHCAADAAAALAAVDALAPEAALLDIGLPGMDGYALARRLREGPHGGSLSLIAITGYGQKDDRRIALACGFDEHLVKPVDPDVVFATLARLLAGSPP
jgi:signal transduction histidine kinase/CheY-like chemotaxis protein